MANEIAPALAQQLAALKEMSEFNVGSVNEIFTDGISSAVATLSLRSSKWRITRDGVETVVSDEEGNSLSTFKCVIVTAAPNIQRTYYAGKYTENSQEEPDCHSNDGIRPDKDSSDPQSTLCAKCPQYEWGSAISEMTGKPIRACKENKKLALVDYFDMDAAPMLFRVPRTALGEFKAYVQDLQKRGATPAMVVTQLGFDTSVDYPKPTFKAVAILSPEELGAAGEHVRSGAAAQVLGLTPPAPEGEVKPDAAATQGNGAAKVTKKKVSKKKATTKKAEPKVSDEDVKEIEQKASLLEGLSQDESDILSGLGDGAFAALNSAD